MHKLASISMALIVAGGVMIAAPATAAPKISNGVACKKLGAINKSTSGTYKCAKNPLSSSSKMTWFSVECLDTAAIYIKTKKLLPQIKTSSDVRVAEIDIDLNKAKASMLDLNTNGPAKIALVQIKLDTAKAKLLILKNDTANLVKNTKAISEWERAIKAYEKNISELGASGKSEIQRAIDRLTIYRTTATSQYSDTQQEVSSALVMSKLLCDKGY